MTPCFLAAPHLDLQATASTWHVPLCRTLSSFGQSHSRHRIRQLQPLFFMHKHRQCLAELVVADHEQPQLLIACKPVSGLGGLGCQGGPPTVRVRALAGQVGWELKDSMYEWLDAMSHLCAPPPPPPSFPLNPQAPFSPGPLLVSQPPALLRRGIKMGPRRSKHY